MRILLVLGTSAGGVGRHVHGLVSGLVDQGHSVVVACPPEVETHFGFAAAGARHVPLTVTDRPHPLRDLRALSTLGDLLRHADVVHAHGLRAGALAGLAAVGSQVPVVVTLHNAAPTGRLTGRLYAVLERVVARRATVVLGVSQDLVDRMDDLGARSGGLAVIPGPRPSQVAGGPSDPSGPSQVRRDLAIPEGPALAVVVARLAPQKGLHLLLDALQQVRDLPLEVVVAGEGPQRGELQARIDAEGLPVRLLGQRADVPALCAAADVVVSSAVWEGQPINLQEALHAGAAIVATDVGGSAAVVGDAALLVPGGDAQALADGIRVLVTDPRERARRQQRSRERAEALPTEADAVAAALEIYERVAGAR
jgi:glycosyltransferase involved in cell wall biosynthesis